MIGHIDFDIDEKHCNAPHVAYYPIDSQGRSFWNTRISPGNPTMESLNIRLVGFDESGKRVVERDRR